MAKQRLRPGEAMLVTNGLTRKRHPFQIISYVIFFGDILVYFLFLVPNLSNVLKIIACVVITIPAIATVYFAYTCTKIDPSDHHVKEHRKALVGQKTYQSDGDCPCTICNVLVSSSSKHCKRCCRCVEGFDHHCKWINNCIGTQNYRPFIKMIVSVFLFTATFTVFMILGTISYADDQSSLENSYSNERSVQTGLMVVVWVFSAPTVILMILIFNLIALHIHLYRMKMTTYDYILYIQGRKEYNAILKEQEKETKMRRASEIQTDTDEIPLPKRTCFDFVLCLNKKKRNRHKTGLVTQKTEFEGREMPCDGITGTPIPHMNEKNALMEIEKPKKTPGEAGGNNGDEYRLGEPNTRQGHNAEEQRHHLNLNNNSRDAIEEGGEGSHYTVHKTLVTKNLDHVIPIKLGNSSSKQLSGMNESNLMVRGSKTNPDEEASNTDRIIKQSHELQPNWTKNLLEGSNLSKTPQLNKRKINFDLENRNEVALSFEGKIETTHMRVSSSTNELDARGNRK